MTWTEHREKILKSGKVNKKVQILKNYKQYYKRYNHKLVFVFRGTEKINDMFSSYSGFRSYSGHDFKSVQKVCDQFRQHGVAYKIMNNWYNVLVYVEDIDAAIKAVPRTLRRYCEEIHLMEDSVADFYQQFKTEDFKGVLTVKKSLPYDRYRYRINFSNSTKKYHGIDKQQLASAAQLLKGYSGLKFPPDFEQRLTGFYHQSAPYFYAENLDWLSMFLLATPSIIHSIELFKTEEEINQGEIVNES